MCVHSVRKMVCIYIYGMCVCQYLICSFHNSFHWQYFTGFWQTSATLSFALGSYRQFFFFFFRIHKLTGNSISNPKLNCINNILGGNWTVAGSNITVGFSIVVYVRSDNGMVIPSRQLII